MKIALSILSLLCIPFAPCFGWSAPGHEAVGIAAMQMLKGTPTEAKVNAILDGDSPEDAAVWLDQVRENYRFPEESQNEEAGQFRQDFPNSANWHFCNFIVGSTSYDFASKYASDDDVVHALERAVAVLEGQSSKMSKQQALRTVFHLVGDIHQPLHCITGYYDLGDMRHPTLLTDVDDPSTAVEDRGGNQLYYTPSQELHAMWDLKIPAKIGKDVDSLAAAINPGDLSSQAVTPGDYHHWAEAWAGESMVAANAAYAEIKKYNAAQYVDDPRHPGKQKLEISITIPKSYMADQQDRAKQQLTRASVRLAQLLEKIQFAE